MAGLHTAHHNYRAHRVGRVRQTNFLWKLELDELDARLHGLFIRRLLDV